jgi:hypothetical protein
MTCDYETRWRILGRLILSESQHTSWFDRKIFEGDEMRRVMRWMVAIDAGIRDVERIKETAAESEKK